MKIALDILKKVLPNAEFINFNGDEEFDYINIAKIDGQNPDTDKHLFFAIHDTQPSVEGWFIDKIDRRIIFPKVTYDKPHWTFVIEKEVKDKLNPIVKAIVVDNINRAIKQLYQFVLDIAKPKVCAVTGSVGKTTTVCLLEDIISLEHKCLRVYSKRITPYILFSFVINKLEHDTKFIVLEFGLYRKEHVSKLAELLPPNISVMLNVLKMHIGVNGIENQQQILEAKSKIIVSNSIPVLNVDDKFIKTLNNGNSLTFSSKTSNGDIYLVNSENEELNINCKGQMLTVKPYLLTDLTVNQTLVAIAVALLLKIDFQLVELKINNFKPKEHRIGKYLFNNKTVIFDGDVSHSARLGELGNNYYAETTLIVYNLDFSEEKADYLIPDLLETFKKFTRVRILNVSKNINQFYYYQLPDNSKFVEHSELTNDVPTNGVIILHYSKYFREPTKHGIEPTELLNTTN